MSKAHIMMGNIQVLNLANNCIKNVLGIDRLYSLEILHLGNNEIGSLGDVAGLAKLPELTYLNLKGNPIEKDGVKNSYRLKVFNLFKESRLDKTDKRLTFRDLIALLPNIDDVEISKKELLALRNLTFMPSVMSTREEATEINSVGPSSTLESFHDESTGPNGSFLAETANSIQEHKPTTRKSRRSVVKIIDCTISSYDDCNQEAGIAKRRKKKRKKANRKYTLDMYPSLENILQSMDMNRRENMTQLHGDISGGDKEDLIVAVEEHSLVEDDIDKTRDFSQSASETDTILDQIDAALIHPIILYENVECIVENDADEADDNVDDDENNDDNNKQTSTVTEPSRQSDHNDISVSTIGDEPIELVKEKTAQEKLMDTFNFALAENTSTYDGPDEYSNLLVSSYLELYFKSFVFPPTSFVPMPVDFSEKSSQEQAIELPRIQLYQSDRDLMMWTLAQNKNKGLASNLHESGEQLIALSSERVIACGIAATGRIAPIESEAKGVRCGTLFHEGKPLLMSECQDLLLCISNKAVYFIPDIVKVKQTQHRRFPSPIPNQARFEEAMWPHAYCRHPLKFLKKITFDGFGFQRLTLHFKLPSVRGEVYVQPENGLFSAFDYTYVIFSCNQRRTIELMQTLQRGAKEAANNSGNIVNDVKVENDDNSVLVEIGKALSPNTFNDDILHYQILTQIWQTNDLEGSRRAFILTNEKIYLFHETYTGDGLGCATLISDDNMNVENGNIKMRLIARSQLQDIVDVCTLNNEDARKISITIKAKSGLRRTSRWILLCKDSENADKLIQDLRKAKDGL